MSSELEKLYAELRNIESLFFDNTQDLPIERLYELHEKIEVLKKEIQKQKIVLEKEKFEREMFEREERACCCMQDDYEPRVAKKRIIPVDENGEPIKELGNGKWGKK